MAMEHMSCFNFLAHSHMCKHIFNLIDSMAVKGGVQLGTPDMIHIHHHPTTLPQLVSKHQFNCLRT